MMLKDNYILRQEARQALSGNWGEAVVAALIAGILAGIVSNAKSFFDSFTDLFAFVNPFGFLSLIYNILVANVISFGLAILFLKLFKKEKQRLEDLFIGFKNYGNVVTLMLLISIFVLLWSLLFIIPGIVASYRYSMAVYIMFENPGMTATEAIKKSKDITMGVKGKIFALDLSFIGWFILCIFTCGIGFLWLQPYWNTSRAAFYRDLISSKQVNDYGYADKEEIITLEE